jgi:DNA-binding transcriptional MerR regulator
MFASGYWPFWTFAAFPDLTEFWTPSFADYVREMFMVQNVSINQMLDNAEAINKPQKVVNVGAIEDLSQLKYRRDGLIFTKGDFDANKVVQTLNVPSINTPIQVFNVLEGIQEKASGVTAGSKGVEDTTGKVGIYQGNQEAAADRFGLFNKSYSFGTSRFAKLYQCGVKENLTKKVAVDIVGPSGIEVVEIKRSDLFKKNDEYTVLVEASNQEVLVTLQEMQEKMKFLASQAINPIQNPKKAYEISAKTAGFTPEEIRELLDTSEFGNSELMSEAERDIESLLEGETIPPNAWANNAYKQRMVDYLKDHQEDMSNEQFDAIAEYIRSLDSVIVGNEVRAFNQGEVDRLNNESALAANGGKPVAPKNGVGLAGPSQINNNPAQ